MSERCDGCDVGGWNLVKTLFTGQLTIGVVAFILWGWAAYASNETDKDQSVEIAKNGAGVVEIRKMAEVNAAAFNDHRVESKQDKRDILDAIKKINR